MQLEKQIGINWKGLECYAKKFGTYSFGRSNLEGEEKVCHQEGKYIHGLQKIHDSLGMYTKTQNTEFSGKSYPQFHQLFKKGSMTQ